MTNEKSILVPRRLLDALKEYMEWGKSRVDPRPLSEWMDEVLAKPDEPEAARCRTCSRFLEQRCPVCGPVLYGADIEPLAPPPVDNDHVAEGCEKFGEHHD